MKKKNYRLETNLRGKVVFVDHHHNYCRPIKTFSEIRQNDLSGEECAKLYGVRARPRRTRDTLDAWNDMISSRYGGKSWKDYTKNRHQWEGRGAVERREQYSPLMTEFRRFFPFY